MKKFLIFICTLTCILQGQRVWADSDVTTEKNAQNTPEGWTAVSLPSIPAITASNTFDITNYGASTSSSNNASAIQAAVDAANRAGGGMVVIPAGKWLSGPLVIKSKVVLHLAANATLQMLDYDTYPHDKNQYFIGTGSSQVSDVIIEGESQETSILEGDGRLWWDNYKTMEGSRPGALIRFLKGKRFLVRNIRLQNAPNTNLTLGSSGNASHFTVHDVTIYAPSSKAAKPSHNTDGIPVWGPYVNIYDCYISTGDDNIVFDSNSQYGHAWNCTFGTGHGASIGSYTEKLHDIIFENITFDNTETGFRIKSSRGRSGNNYSGTSSNGSVSNIICRNATMTGVRQPIMLTQMYDSDVADPSTVIAAEVTYQTPEFCNILFQNIKSTGTVGGGTFKYGAPIYINGLPESYIHDITFDNVQVSAQKGMWMAYCKDIKFINGCSITNLAGTGDFQKKYNVTFTGDYSSETGITQVPTDKASLTTPTKYLEQGHIFIRTDNGLYNIGGQKMQYDISM